MGAIEGDINVQVPGFTKSSNEKKQTVKRYVERLPLHGIRGVIAFDSFHFTALLPLRMKEKHKK